jgi:hypothetical protein
VSLFVLGWPQPAHARLCARYSADYALAQAALVVKGVVESIDTPPGIDQDSTITIPIDRALKGRVSTSSVTATFFPCGQEHQYALTKDRPVIAFLDGTGKLIEVLPASSHLARPDASPAAALRQELLTAIDDSDRRLALFALGALAELDGRNAVPTLKRYRNATDYGVRFRALTWLARYGGADAFEQVTRLVSEPSFAPGHPDYWTDADEPVSTAHRDLQHTLSRLSSDAYNGVPPRQRIRFLDALIALAQIETRLFRNDAIYALRQMNDPAAYPVLLEALDDRDRDVRLNAVYALCQAMDSGDAPWPTFNEFAGDEQKYIAPIRAWAHAQLR